MSPAQHLEHSRKHRQRTGPQRRVRETSYPKFWYERLERPIATRNWPEQKCRLRYIRNIRGSSVSGPQKNGAGMFEFLWYSYP